MSNYPLQIELKIVSVYNAVVYFAPGLIACDPGETLCKFGKCPNSCTVCATQLNPMKVRVNCVIHPEIKTSFIDFDSSQINHRGTKQKKIAHGGKGI